MDIKIQIISLIASYVFGILFYILNKINSKIIYQKNRIIQSLSTILFIYNIVLLYIIIMFKINHGTFHIYFIFMIILGFITTRLLTGKIKKNVKYFPLIAKIKRMCYTKNNKG